MQISISILVGNANSGISYVKRLIRNFKARVLSYPNSIFEAEACLDATLEELNGIGLLDNASLIITPNAYNEGILYDVIPNTPLGDMDVVRATTATRVNADGLIEVVPRNLASYSEQFDNASWVKTNTTITSNTTIAPNGTLTADTLGILSGQYLYQNIAITSSNIYTISIYVKVLSGTKQFKFNVYGSGNNFTSSAYTATTQWQKFNYTFIATGTGGAGIYPLIVDGLTGGDFYIWGAQLEAGSTSTSYFPTTTRLNIPRLDYSGGGCPSILVEPQRTNLITYSEQFNDASWVKLNATVTANYSVSPDGTQNADRIQFTTSNTSSIYRAIGGATTDANSIYVKGVAGEKVLFGYGANISVGTLFTLNGEWQRLEQISTTGTVFHIGNYSGGTASDILIWGAQREAGSNATSYIPTVASTVTRNADVISKTGIDDLIGQTEGTIFVDFKISGFQAGAENRFAISDGTTSNWIFIGIPEDGNNKGSRFYIRTNGSTAVDFGTPNYFTLNTQYKIALAYKSGSWAIYTNGALLTSGTDAIANPSSPFSNLIYNGSSPSPTNNQPNTNQFNSVQLYKTRLSNTELSQLTTI